MLEQFSALIVFGAAIPTGDADGGGSVVGLTIYVSIALGASFLCSILEAVLLSSSTPYLEAEKAKGSKSASRMLHLKAPDEIDRSISAILTLNTIAHTVGAAGAGAEAAGIFGNEWLGVISAVLTFLILVGSEIIPKTLGAVYWKRLVPLSASSTSILVRVLYPIVWSCQWITELIKPKTKEPTVSRAEIEILARRGHEEGTIAGGENRILSNILRLGSIRTQDILTPRIVMFSLDGSKTVDQTLADQPLTFSRIPLHDGNPDAIDHFVLRFDVLEAAAHGKGHVPLQELGRPLTSVPAVTDVGQLLERFVEEKKHMFVVVDEFGGTQGIVTLEDAMETLLGTEITDETDAATDLREVARQQAEIRRKHRAVRYAATTRTLDSGSSEPKRPE